MSAGRIVAEGAPAQVVKNTARSPTARILGEFLKERGA